MVAVRQVARDLHLRIASSPIEKLDVVFSELVAKYVFPFINMFYIGSLRLLTKQTTFLTRKLKETGLERKFFFFENRKRTL
jgi:hypothetical protein